ncbi:hypothetical protein KHQ82_08745 [Mycoplasmatota bacterium]|nr:hypothetical protein KHQ82_08745 [Mycoplasmatota bacterium]
MNQFSIKKFLLGHVFGLVVISGVVFFDKILLFVISTVAARAAFAVVGWLYSIKLINTVSEGGRSRLYLYVIITSFLIWLTVKIVEFIDYIISLPATKYIGSGIGILLIISIVSEIFSSSNSHRVKKERYERLSVNHSSTIPSLHNTNTVANENIQNKEVSMNNNVMSNKKKRYKTVYELWREKPEQNKRIKITNDDPLSPDLRYISVYYVSHNKPVMGYIQMRKGQAKYGEVYYPNEEKWRLY